MNAGAPIVASAQPAFLLREGALPPGLTFAFLGPMAGAYAGYEKLHLKTATRMPTDALLVLRELFMRYVTLPINQVHADADGACPACRHTAARRGVEHYCCVHTPCLNNSP